MDDFAWDTEEDDRLLEAWAEVDRQAAALLRRALDEVLSEPAPDDAPEDLDAWIGAIVETIAPSDLPAEEDIEAEAAVAALDHGDWLALGITLVRRGPGAELDTQSWYDAVRSTPEVDVEAPDEDDPDDYVMAVETLAPKWQALGLLDEDRRLTPRGRWALPQALLTLWDDGEEHESAGSVEEADAQTAIRLLAGRPMTFEELRTALAREGIFTDIESLESSLIWRNEIFEFDEDGRWVHLPTLTEGAVLTHRLQADELALGVVDPTHDLGLIDFLASDGLPLVGGGQVKTEFRGNPRAELPAGAPSGLVGPPGWLERFEPDALLGFRYVGGALAVEEVEPVEDPVFVEQLLRTARRLAAEEPDDGFPGMATYELVLTLLREHPGAFADPHPPLSELLEDSGLEVRLGSFGLPDTDWYEVPDWLPDDQRATYTAWRDALTAHHLGLEVAAEDVCSLAERMHGIVEDLAAVDAAVDPDRAEPVLAVMLEATTGRDRAVPLFLLARTVEAAGEGPRMLDLLEAAVDADPEHSGALADLGDLRALAGDAREAMRLYRAAMLDLDAPEVRALRTFLEPPAGPGRNKPCPCGSGKKYKLCHGRTDQHPLVDRGGWLLVKVKAFLQRSRNREELLRWAEVRTGHARHDRENVTNAMADAFTWDLALFDGGVLDDFLELYGFLLPEDELGLIRQWRSTQRRLLEVLAVHPGRGITARDLLTEEELEVPDRMLTRTARPKDLLYGRLLDQGDGQLRLWDDPLGLPRTMRPRLLQLLREDASPVDVARLLAGGGPDALQTTEGEELLLCRARYVVPDLDATWSALERELEPVGNELHDLVPAPGGGSLLRGTVSRTGEHLIVQALALERLRRLQARVLEVAPAAELVDESSIDPLEIFGQDAREASPVKSAPQLSSEAMEQVVIQIEERWLAETIPALGGLTPAEAAASGAHRRDLLALLDDLEWTRQRAPEGLAMDPDRLRARLGLA